MKKKSNCGEFTQLLERLEAFEERAGVRLDALYASIADSSGFTINGKFVPGIRINGEIHPREGTTLAKHITVEVVAYDSSGRLIDAADARFSPETFFGFGTFSLLVGGIPPEQITKIRVYPKLGW